MSRRRNSNPSPGEPARDVEFHRHRIERARRGTDHLAEAHNALQRYLRVNGIEDDASYPADMLREMQKKLRTLRASDREWIADMEADYGLTS